MRTLILSALLLAAAAPVVAQIAPAGRDEHRERVGGSDRGGERRFETDRGGERRFEGERGGDRRDHRDDRRDDRGFRGDRRDDRGDRGDFRGDRGERRDFGDDRRHYGDGDRDARFRGERFDYPRGYRYRYYGVGGFLPRAYFYDRYYIGQPEVYRLPRAYAGTRWVRVGPDALLIRAYDGRVVRIIRGLFY